jgi:hypothetical protein
MTSKHKPLALSDTLRDLALLRVSDVNLSTLLPATSSDSAQAATSSDDTDRAAVDSSVSRSYEFATEARKAIKILNRGDVESQGTKIENVRRQLEDVLKGLETNS